MGDWTYEAKDFLTPAPYEALYQFHGQPFVHETKLQELSVYAASQGFRGFKSMYKKYIESLKAQAGTVYVDNVTNFTGQPLELNAGDWDATDLGVYRRNGFADELACPHPIMPVERLINIDTGEEKLKLAFRKGTLWRRLIISKTILANANKGHRAGRQRDCSYQPKRPGICPVHIGFGKSELRHHTGAQVHRPAGLYPGRRLLPLCRRADL